MRAFVEVLCPGNPDCGSAFHLFIDGIRLQFGCGDGVQRTSAETGVKPSKLVSVFTPTLSALDVSGLPGMLLTASDAGLSEIVVAGPVGLNQLLRAARPFFLRPSLKMDVRHVTSVTSNNLFKNESLVVRGVLVTNKAVAYVSRFIDMKGKFDPKRATDLGVPRGKLFGVLQKGNPVTLDDGTQILPEQVMEPSIPGPVVVAIPPLTESKDIDKLVENDELTADALNTTTQGRIALVVHFSEAATVTDERYQRWARLLGDNVRHIVIHRDFAPERVVYSSNIEELSMLHEQVDAQFFPLPVHSVRRVPPSAGDEPPPMRATYPELKSAIPTDWIRPELRLRFELAPLALAGSTDFSLVPDARVPRPITGAPTATVEGGSKANLLDTDTAPTKPAHLHLDDTATEVSFLGTGAALPGKHRNVSAIHLRVASRCGVLMDCGEGTYGQLCRLHGDAGVRRTLEQLRVLFISHMHADHHLGALRLLAERARLGGDNGRICVVAPKEFGPWIGSALSNDGGARDMQLFDAAELTDPQTSAARFFSDSLGLEIGTVRVPHCVDSFALILADQAEKWKLVYSGDTRPCDALVDAGMGATLLIHEATMEDRLKAEAQEKMHTTVGEALDVAQRMGAWRTVLTHFSQRYPKVPALDAGTVRRCEAIGATVACDFMRVPFRRLEHLPRVTPRYRDVFKQDIEDMLQQTPQDSVT